MDECEPLIRGAAAEVLQRVRDDIPRVVRDDAGGRGLQSSTFGLNITIF